jgi:hypothetical protein
VPIAGGCRDASSQESGAPKDEDDVENENDERPGSGPTVSVTSAEQYRAHAAFRARTCGAGIGAALVRSTSNDTEHVWECIVTDGREWHHIRVLGSGLGPFPDLSVEAIESGIERFAGTLPAQNRMYDLLNANPLHVDGNGNVRD